jgi:hypothetical protein
MRKRVRTLLKIAAIPAALLLIAGITAPALSDPVGQKVRRSLERALGRTVEFQGPVRFNLFRGPGVSVERVIIHEDPAIGSEPIAYVQGGMEVRPSLWSLLLGRLAIASIRLEDASINLAKSTPADQPGRWNFLSFVNRSAMSAAPAIHVRNGRINFKFGETKSVFYLTETDLDIAPPGSSRAGWSVYCSAKPARTDRTAQGLGSFKLEGRWFVTPERVDLDLVLERTGLGDLAALLSGQAGDVHGTISSRLHLGGPIGAIGIQGRLTIEDVHRWDLLPPGGRGWPLDIQGRLDLVGELIELESNPPGNATLPLWVAFRANDYLSRPRWGVTVNWNRFPMAPVLELARHMGAQFPPRLALSGSMDGAIGYSGEGSFQGELGFRDAAVTIPGSPPVRFEQARVVVDHGHARLEPALVRTASGDQAHLQADYDLDEGTLDLAISADGMAIESLRTQVAMAAVPWLEQVRSGRWTGQLRYRGGAGKSGWSGRLDLADAQIAVPGLADPLELASARAQIDGARLSLDRMNARAGKLAFTGEYRYEPGTARPHRLRLRADEVDAADLEDELAPTLARNASLIARALGRAPLPDWLRQRAVDGTLQIEGLVVAGTRLDNVRGRLLWDGARAELDGIQARLEHAAVTGKLTINLRGIRPSYRFAGKLKGLGWQSGKLDAEGTLEASGAGARLLASLTSKGTFTGTALDLGTAPLRAVSGSYALAWSQGTPRWRLTDLALQVEDETYTGSGATQDDGRLMIVLTNGAKEMRMSGSLASLRVEEGPPAPKP